MAVRIAVRSGEGFGEGGLGFGERAEGEFVGGEFRVVVFVGAFGGRPPRFWRDVWFERVKLRSEQVAPFFIAVSDQTSAVSFSSAFFDN